LAAAGGASFGTAACAVFGAAAAALSEDASEGVCASPEDASEIEGAAESKGGGGEAGGAATAAAYSGAVQAIVSFKLAECRR
jgi:hypothetical protein